MDSELLVEMAAATDCRVHTSAFVIKVNGTGCCGATWGRMERVAFPGIVSPESCRLLMEGSCCSLVSKVTLCICTSVNGCTAGLNQWVKPRLILALVVECLSEAPHWGLPSTLTYTANSLWTKIKANTPAKIPVLPKSFLFFKT